VLGLTCRGSATPRAHRRGDLGQQINPSSSHSPFRRREVVLVRENQTGQLTSESQVIPPVGDDEDGQRVIWGTNVSISDSMKRFRDFLLRFQRKYRLRADGIEVAEGEGEEFTYVEMLKMACQCPEAKLILDASNSLVVIESIDSRLGCVS
jgi:DNA replication licensing factor MCM4